MATYNENLAKLVDTNGKITADDLPAIGIDSLTDVSVSGATVGQTMQWNGTQWVPAQVSAPDTSTFATKTYVDTQVANIVNGASAAFDTFGEIATILGNDPAIGASISSFIQANKMKVFVADGSSDTFAIPHVAGRCDVWLNGVQLVPEIPDSTVTDGSNNLASGSYSFQSVDHTASNPILDLSGSNYLTDEMGTARAFYDSMSGGMYFVHFHAWDANNTIGNSLTTTSSDQVTAFVTGDGGATWIGPFKGGGPTLSNTFMSGNDARSQFTINAGSASSATDNYSDYQNLLSTITWNGAGMSGNNAHFFAGDLNSYPVASTNVITVGGTSANSVKLASTPASGDKVIVRCYGA